MTRAPRCSRSSTTSPRTPSSARDGLLRRAAVRPEHPRPALAPAATSSSTTSSYSRREPVPGRRRRPGRLGRHGRRRRSTSARRATSGNVIDAHLRQLRGRLRRLAAAGSPARRRRPRLRPRPRRADLRARVGRQRRRGDHPLLDRPARRRPHRRLRPLRSSTPSATSSPSPRHVQDGDDDPFESLVGAARARPAPGGGAVRGPAALPPGDGAGRALRRLERRADAPWSRRA